MTFWGIVWAIIGGALIGMVARLILPGRQSIPLWLTIIVGIVGMFVGDWLARLLHVEVTSGFDWIRHGLQVVVAIVGVAAVAALGGRSRT
jgi:uncharacterized membrane protein YeaQ/YmgE (transglycosylase-associated protein family)